MIRRAILLSLLVVAPTVASAQRGGASSRATKKEEMFDKKEGQNGPSLRVRDIEDQSPVKLLIDKRKDLKLTDDQVKAFKSAEDKLNDKNKPLFKAVDSLLHDMKYSLDKPSDEDRARIRGAQNGFGDVMAQINANYDEAAKGLIAMLDADTQAKANDLVAKQRAESDKMVREKLGGGMR